MQITRWITNVVAARKATPPPTVHHLKPMPDVEKLMGEWPPSVEAMLKTVSRGRRRRRGDHHMMRQQQQQRRTPAPLQYL